MSIVIIAGSRDITDYSHVERAVFRFHTTYPSIEITKILSGGARGVDQLAIQWAKNNDKSFSVINAKWRVFGRSAGHARNLEMSRLADALIAVWDGSSHGTLDMITIMRDLGKPHHIYTP